MTHILAQVLQATASPGKDPFDFFLREISKNGSESYIFLALAIKIGIASIIALTTGIIAMFYFYRGVYNTRIKDKELIVEEYKKIIVQYYELNSKNLEVLKNLTDALNISNEKNQELITVLENNKIENLREKIKTLEEENNKRQGGSI